MSDKGFQQAPLPVIKEREFEQLRRSVERAFEATQVGKFLGRLDEKKIRIRDFAGMLRAKVLEEFDRLLAAGDSALALYEGLPASDQAQIREFYLTRLEQVDDATRERFQNLYRTY